MRPKAELQAEQFLANFEAWCVHCHAPAVEVLGSQRDRCEFAWTDDWQEFCESKMDRQDTGISAHRNFPGRSLEGYRDAVHSIAGAQVIKRETPDGSLCGEADLDWGVPTDVLGLVVHIVKDFAPNKLFGRRANQFALARYFRRKRGWEIRNVRKENQT